MKPTLSKLALLACACLLANASSAREPVFEPRRIALDLWDSAHFQRAHPDLKHRVAAQNLLEEGSPKAALAEFERAAHWGDKLSQAMLAEMYWEGTGTKPDRPRAYAWMDLAAERGFLGFVAKRERYWAALSEAERIDAIAIGARLYADYGDSVSLPRLHSRLAREGRSTGSRTRFPGNGKVVLPTPGTSYVTIDPTVVMARVFGGNQISLTSYYSRQHWDSADYVEWQGRQLELARRGMVRVGAVKDPP